MNAPHDSSHSMEDAPARPMPQRSWLERILIGIVCSTSAAFGAWVLLPKLPIFKTTAVIQIKFSQPKLLSDRPDRSPPETVPYEIYQRTQSQTLMSEVVLSKALRRPGISDASDLPHAADPLQWLETHLDVEAPHDSELMMISLWGLRPHGLDFVLDAVHTTYFDEIVNVERNGRVQRLSELERIMEQKQEEIRYKRNAITNIQDVMDESSPSFEMADRRKKISLLEGISDRLAIEIEELRIELNAPPRITLVTPASRPQAVAWNLRMPMTIAIGLVFLLLTQIVLARWNAMLTPRRGG